MFETIGIYLVKFCFINGCLGGCRDLSGCWTWRAAQDKNLGKNLKRQQEAGWEHDMKRVTKPV